MNKQMTTRTGLLCALLLLAMSLVRAQAPAATPAAEQQARAWLTVFDSGDRPALLEFLTKNHPSAVGHIDGEMGFRAQTGGFELIKVQESTPGRFTALLKEKDSDQFARIELEVESDAPHRISKMELRAIPRPPEYAIPRVSEPEAVALFGERLKEESAADRFSGTALVAKGGKIVFEEAYGMADREKKIPNQASTQFRIGSMNKMFTAVSIMQLVQAGKIQLSDPFGKYLPDYANREMASKVTIEQLLSHTGGTGDFFGPEFDAHRRELKTLQDYVKLYEKRPLKFAPGTQWDYSNYGFLLLGVVIEKVTGQSYYDYVREHVFKAAGMTMTDSLPENEAVPGRSVGYTKGEPGPWTPNTDTLPWRGTSAGGGYSTVEDLYHFAMALQDHKLLDAAHTEMLMKGGSGRPGGEHYGYGFGISDEGGMSCFGHGGGAPGMNGELKVCPEAGYVIAVLANLDPPAASRAAEFVALRLPLK
jgi:CubicO group peptidase (beta-lactamase class C family)